MNLFRVSRFINGKKLKSFIKNQFDTPEKLANVLFPGKRESRMALSILNWKY